MIYRDDAGAILARLAALERELAAARREIVRLKRRAGEPVEEPAEAAGAPVEVEVLEEDVARARQTLLDLIGELDADPADLEGAAAPVGPDAVLAALRRALLGLLGRKAGEVPKPLIARIDACDRPGQLSEWIAAAGAARSGRGALRALERY